MTKPRSTGRDLPLPNIGHGKASIVCAHEPVCLTAEACIARSMERMGPRLQPPATPLGAHTMKRVPTDRAVRRFLQIAALEDSVKLTESAIDDVQKELADAEDRLGDLRKQKSDLMKEMRAAASDEGQLPLFDNLPELLTDVGGATAH